MTIRTAPPFRADHVGSFLRPKFLLDAREQKAKGEINAAQLRAVEDKAIAEIVKFQQDVGLQSITGGASSSLPSGFLTMTGISVCTPPSCCKKSMWK